MTDAVVVGMEGEIFRGAKPIGMSTPCDLSISSLAFGIDQNPDSKAFKLRVNPFAVNIAQRVVEGATRIRDVSIEVEGVGSFSQSSWRLEPLE